MAKNRKPLKKAAKKRVTKRKSQHESQDTEAGFKRDVASPQRMPQRMSGGISKQPARSWKKPEKEMGEADVRMMDERVKTARGRKISSTLWLRRQLNDPYVKKARALGYRSRAAFKLIELDAKYDLLKRGSVIVDLGAAPGSWTQIALKVKPSRIIGIDILPVEPVAGAEIIEMDFMDEKAPEVLMRMLAGDNGMMRADLVMSDLAANTTGHRNTDHLRTVALVEEAADFAVQVLKPGGAFISKVFQGGAELNLLNMLNDKFETVRHAKPKSSRDGSPEMYLVAKGFKG